MKPFQSIAVCLLKINLVITVALQVNTSTHIPNHQCPMNVDVDSDYFYCNYGTMSTSWDCSSWCQYNFSRRCRFWTFEESKKMCCLHSGEVILREDTADLISFRSGYRNCSGFAFPTVTSNKATISYASGISINSYVLLLGVLSFDKNIQNLLPHC